MSKITELVNQISNLKGAEIIKNLSTDELEKIYNGIGPDMFPDWLRKIITDANGLFEPAALIHDVRYQIGGTKADFTAANTEFKENCYTLVKQEYSWYNPMRYVWMNKARRWGNYCEMFGWTSYNKHDGEKA